MKSRLLIIYACFGLVMAGNIFGQDIRQEGRRYVAEIKKEFKTGAQGSLEMREITGDVTVKAWEQNKVEILETVNMEVFTMEEAKRVLEACQASYSQTGDIILVEGRERPRRSSDSHFRISVPSHFNLDIGTSGGDLAISQVKGTIKLRTSGGDVDLFETGGEVRASTSGGDVTVRSAEGRVSVKTSGGNLELEGIKGALDGQTSGGNITLRGANQTVDLRTSGGNIEIVDVTGAVVAKTSGGNVEVENTSGNVEVSTSGGDVVLRSIKGEIEASTSGGDVRATTLLGPANLRTSGGDINVRDLMARLQASTSGGTVSVEMTLADFSKPHDLSLSSSGGEVELTIPAKLPAKIYAEIRLGDGWNWGERYDIQSDFPLRIERDDKGERAGRYIRGEGEINGGGNIISLRTSGGNIVIRKGR
ncbi:DUF4097 domain-containing protein [Cytophagia bacterium CHB2]|nr:DUF4097 domain-containing protein [Cytophagia bacterium CHB2]